MANTKTYLALGDSYTIGEGCAVSENFPNILATKLAWQTPKIIAKTGWTTRDLIKAIENEKVESKFDTVSLLIGVNNQYQGLSFEEFKKDFEQLVKIGQELAEKQFFMVSIPNYGTTDFGKSWSQYIFSEIQKINAFQKQFCLEKGIKFVDIFELSNACNQKKFLVEDNLHPSSKQYELWVEEIIKIIDNE